MNTKIVFYTLIYKIKSKFNFEKYQEWGNNLIKNLKDQTLIIYTDKNTYNLLKNILNGNNIKIVLLELTNFKYYKYIDYFSSCTKLTEGYDIDPKLLLIWLERIIILNNLKNLIISEFYSFLDFGYFRDETIYYNFLQNNIILNKEKIYYCLVKNDIIYIKNEILLYYKEHKEYPIKNDGMIGGGFFIIHFDKINFYINLYESKILLYINNKRLIKDDQIILTDIIFDKNNIEHFELITDINSNLNLQYRNKIISNNNYKDFIQSIYYLKLIFENKKNTNLYHNYINITEKQYEIKNFDNIINYINDDNWFVFKKFLNDNNYTNYIINSHKLLFYDYYLGYDVNYDIYFENKIITVMKKDNNMYILFNIDLNDIDYLILYDLLDIFINIQNLNINKFYNIDYEIIIELSKIFNFKFIYDKLY